MSWFARVDLSGTYLFLRDWADLWLSMMRFCCAYCSAKSTYSATVSYLAPISGLILKTIFLVSLFLWSTTEYYFVVSSEA
jgi:hypothetical protein